MKVTAVFSVLVLAATGCFCLDYSSIDLPVYGQDGMCATWDLSPLASLPATNFTPANGQYKYVLMVGNNVPASQVPSSCKSKNSSTTYQLDGSNCYTLGKLSDVLVVSYCSLMVHFALHYEQYNSLVSCGSF